MHLNYTKLLENTKTLISFKSISPSQAGAIDYLEGYLKKLNFVTTRVDKGSTSNLIARFGTIGPIFAFAGHIDVVPPGNIDKWWHDPFTLYEDDEKLYGRGICDMKGAVAGFIAACETYLAANNVVNGSIILLITSDEESIAINGTPVIVDYLKKNNIKIDYCLVGEPTSVEILGDVIKVGRRGSLTGTIEVIGKQGHIAYPDLCDNPIHKFAPALTELAETQFDNGSEVFPPTSLQFANINSGLSVTNVVPGSLFANFNLRYNNLHTKEELEDKITNIFTKHQLKFNIKWTSSAQPFYTAPGKLNLTVRNAINQVKNIETIAKTDGGTSDGRFLVEVCNELLELGLSNKSIHQINENILKTDLFDLTNIYYIILDSIFND